MSNLESAIERLFAAFASIVKPVRIDGCPCCIEGKEIDILLRKPLREISPDDLSSYASSAFLTVGSAVDYLYFLPRILEITATEPGWWPDPEVTGRAIRSAMPENWTVKQRNALDDYLESIIATAIRAEDYQDLDDWICAIGRMGFDVRPYLNQIAKDPAAVLSFFEDNAKSLPKNRLANTFWELPCPAHDLVVDWFFSDKIAQIPFHAYGYILTRD